MKYKIERHQFSKKTNLSKELNIMKAQDKIAQEIMLSLEEEEKNKKNLSKQSDNIKWFGFLHNDNIH